MIYLVILYSRDGDQIENVQLNVPNYFPQGSNLGLLPHKLRQHIRSKFDEGTPSIGVFFELQPRSSFSTLG